MLADNEIAIHQCRLAIWHTAWVLDQGEKGRHESSITKAFVSEELFKVADRCVQVLGGIGVTDETVVAMIFQDMRGSVSTTGRPRCTSTPSLAGSCADLRRSELVGITRGR